MGRPGLEEIKETQKLPGPVPLSFRRAWAPGPAEAEQEQLPEAPGSTILHQSSELKSKTTPFFDTSPRPLHLSGAWTPDTALVPLFSRPFTSPKPFPLL